MENTKYDGTKMNLPMTFITEESNSKMPAHNMSGATV